VERGSPGLLRLGARADVEQAEVTRVSAVDRPFVYVTHSDGLEQRGRATQHSAPRQQHQRTAPGWVDPLRPGLHPVGGRPSVCCWLARAIPSPAPISTQNSQEPVTSAVMNVSVTRCPAAAARMAARASRVHSLLATFRALTTKYWKQASSARYAASAGKPEPEAIAR